MIKYKIGNQTIELKNSETKQGKGNQKGKAPSGSVVDWRNTAETSRNIDAVCKYILNKDKASGSTSFKVVDAIARAGFWSAGFRNVWPNCQLHINEFEKECIPVLERNFPDDKITHFDIDKKAVHCDLAFLDFDDFTLKKLEQYFHRIISWSNICKYFIIADSACFGFKFGNMKHYGIKTEEEYYFLLSDTLEAHIGKRVTVVSKFNNSAIVLFENPTRRKKDIKFIPPSFITLYKGKKLHGNYIIDTTPLF